MSIANVTISNTNKRNNAVALNFTALAVLVDGEPQYASGRYGAKVIPDKNDSRTVIVLKNEHTSAVVVNIAQGTSPYNAENPLPITVPAGGEMVVSLDSALYKDLSFDGYVVYTTDANYEDVSVACIILP